MPLKWLALCHSKTLVYFILSLCERNFVDMYLSKRTLFQRANIFLMFIITTIVILIVNNCSAAVADYETETLEQIKRKIIYPTMSNTHLYQTRNNVRIFCISSF